MASRASSVNVYQRVPKKSMDFIPLIMGKHPWDYNVDMILQLISNGSNEN